MTLMPKEYYAEERKINIENIFYNGAIPLAARELGY